MSKPKDGKPAANKGDTKPASGAEMAPVHRKDWARETVESIVIAFILACLFRSFEAEAFVIPTGSMATTLMGRHKEFECPKCKFPYRVSASDEVDSETGNVKIDQNGRMTKPVVGATCPNCRFNADFQFDTGKPGRRTNDDSGEAEHEIATPNSYNGDRIVVTKFPYEISDPERWDVAVFKCPTIAHQNYIKRIVGLPNETLIIHHGDIFTLPPDVPAPIYGDLDGLRKLEKAGHLKIQRKPARKLRAVLQVVYDNDYALPELVAAGWPARWGNDEEKSGDAVWNASGDLKSFEVNAVGKSAVLRYRHIPPEPDFPWDQLQRKRVGENFPAPREQLVSDMSGYNTDHTDRGDYGRRRISPDWLGLHWVGDLALELDLTPTAGKGAATLHLREGGREFSCRIDVETGKATLAISGLNSYHPQGDTSVRVGETHRVMFANVDDELTLFVDGKPVSFDAERDYPDLDNHAPTREDLRPAAIEASDVDLRVDHARLYRDLYYIADKAEFHSQRPGGAQLNVIIDYDAKFRSLDVLSDSREWPKIERSRFADFRLEGDQYLLLGDNSARSKDGRLWSTQEHYVRRDLLVGKALFVYWPHGLDKIPLLGIPLPGAFFPNFERMNFVR